MYFQTNNPLFGNGMTFAEYHLGLTQSCNEFWDHMTLMNETFWNNFPPAIYPVSRREKEDRLLLDPSHLKLVNSLPLCPDFPNQLGRL